MGALQNRRSDVEGVTARPRVGSLPPAASPSDPASAASSTATARPLAPAEYIAGATRAIVRPWRYNELADSTTALAMIDELGRRRTLRKDGTGDALNDQANPDYSNFSRIARAKAAFFGPPGSEYGPNHPGFIHTSRWPNLVRRTALVLLAVDAYNQFGGVRLLLGKTLYVAGAALHAGLSAIGHGGHAQALEPVSLDQARAPHSVHGPATPGPEQSTTLADAVADLRGSDGRTWSQVAASADAPAAPAVSPADVSLPAGTTTVTLA